MDEKRELIKRVVCVLENLIESKIDEKLMESSISYSMSEKEILENLLMQLIDSYYTD